LWYYRVMAKQRTLDRLVLRAVLPEELERWEQLMREQHYLHTARIGGEALRYVATIDGEWVALLGWGSAALKCSARDRHIGWDRRSKEKRLFLVANNVRFLVLLRKENLASKVLAMNLRRLSEDWQNVHGHPVYLAETFVDISRGYDGGCYRAANWAQVGQTEGWSKKGDRWERNGRPKAVYVYPLRPDALQKLKEEFVSRESFAPEGGTQEQGRQKIEPAWLKGLMEQIRAIEDPRHRRGVRHACSGVLGIVVCAVLCGARSFRAIGQWAEALTESELKRFATGRREAPSEPTIRRMIHGVDAEGFDKRIGAWIAEQQPLKDKAVAIDGKTLRGSSEGDKPGMHLLSAVLHKGGWC